MEIEATESLLGNHEAIKETVVVMDMGKFSERVVAYIVPRYEADLDLSGIRQHLRKSLPSHMAPTLFILMKQLPLATDGKVDRAALSFDMTERLTMNSAYEGPRNLIEDMLADIWKNILEAEHVGIHDDFLDLGGDSIRAALISMRIMEYFNVEIPLIMFFEDMTIAKAAADICRIQNECE